MKKIKKYFMQSLFLIFILPLVVLTSTVNAYEGDRDSATQKEYYSIFSACIAESSAWNFTSGMAGTGTSLNAISPSTFSDKKWFTDGWFSYVPSVANPWVEKQVTGQYNDGKIKCGEGGNKLVGNALGSLRLDKLEVACNYQDDYFSGGVLDSNDPSSMGCQSASNNGFLVLKNDRSTYLENLVTDKTFNNDVPSGNLKEKTSLENYFMLRDTFETACISGGPYYDNVDRYTYQIYIEDGNGSIAKVGYDRKGGTKGNENIQYFYNYYTTCNDINTLLGDENSNEVADFKDYVSDGGGTSVSTNAEDACYEKAGLDSVSYIVCPAINNTTSVVDTIEEVLRTLLEVDPNDTFSSETYEAWNIFRNIANIFLIIILLIIIFSQLTGYGIDNYGIKKMLPRLIAMAIVINLSYVICELAVDISNILGSGLYELFKGIGMTVNADAAGQDTATIVGGILGALGGASVPVAGAVVAGIAAGGGVMIVISLVLLLLVALVAVVIVFLMLGVRMAIIILFVAISPVAFALYILPNTQNIFKKYWKIAEAALVVFPICGAVCGASFIIRAILLSNSIDGVIPVVSALVAVCMPFLPFFLLPSLLRNVIGGLGAIGGVLSGIGNGIRRGTQSLGDTVKTGVKNSEGFKNAANRRAENRQFRWAERNRNSSNANTRRKAQTLLNERTQQRALDTVGVMNLDTDTAQRRAEAARDAQEYKAAQDQYANYSRDDLMREAGFTRNAAGNYVAGQSRVLGQSQRMKALINTMESRGMESNIYSMLRQNDVSNDEAVMSGLAGSNNKVLKAYGKGGQGVSYDNFMNGTGGPNAGSMQKYIHSKGAEFIKDLDDKALHEIAQYNNWAANNDDVLNEAATSLKNADALSEVKGIIVSRLQSGQGFTIRNDNLAKYTDDIFNEINQYQNGQQAILAASDNLSSEQIKKLGDQRKQAINRIRQANGRPPLP